MLVPHRMEDHKKVLSTQTLIEVEVEVLKPHFEVDMEACMVDEETLEEEEVVEVVLEIIEVNNQITIQIATIAKNLGTWQRTVIKGSMMHEMESCNKGIMHQLTIKVMSNCL